MKIKNNRQSKLHILAILFIIALICNILCLISNAPLNIALCVYIFTILCWCILLKVIPEKIL